MEYQRFADRDKIIRITTRCSAQRRNQFRRRKHRLQPGRESTNIDKVGLQTIQHFYRPLLNWKERRAHNIDNF